MLYLNFGLNRLWLKRIFIAFLWVISYGCIEEFDVPQSSSDSIEDILVVEGNLTDEVKRHRVILSKINPDLEFQQDSVNPNPFIPSFNIMGDSVIYEVNANVSIIDDGGFRYEFDESEPGIYESVAQFGAELGKTYQLEVTTTDGRRFSSTPMGIPGTSTITNIRAEKTISDSGVEGIGIFVDNSPLQGTVQNFRYTYTDTYKIIAPMWTAFEFRLTNYDPCALPVPTYDLDVVPREEEEQVCYNTIPSNKIVQAQLNTDNASLNNFMVRFIGKENFIISHRYSIEVSQLVTSTESFGFYEQLENFSKNESIFSQVQPGSIGGNINAMDGSAALAIGFFDVASVSKSRLFFNYTDFYPDEPLPEFPIDCGIHSSPESHQSFCAMNLGANDCPQSIIERVNLDVISFISDNGIGIGTCPGPYIYVASACGDCTKMGSNVVPEFWTE